MKFLLVLTIVLPSFCFSQQLNSFNETRLKTDQRLMVGLGSWATANFIGSGIGWATAPNKEMESFHQMNVLWNTVNIALAVPGYFGAKRQRKSLSGGSDISLFETTQGQSKTEKIFLINSGLDVGYISAGFILRSEAKTNVKRRDQFNGFGNSLILQGGFLLVFDLTAYFIHNRHRKNGLNPLIKNLELSDTGLGLKWNLETSQKKRAML